MTDGDVAASLISMNIRQSVSAWLGSLVGFTMLLSSSHFSAGNDAPKELARLKSSVRGQNGFAKSFAYVDGVVAVGSPEIRLVELFGLVDGKWGNLGAVSGPPQAREFGCSVAISGKSLVVGAIFESHNQKQSAGAVYVFSRVGESWNLQARLESPESKNYAFFGQSVAIDGDVIAVGATGQMAGINEENHPADPPEQPGMVYVFRRDDKSWRNVAKLKSSFAIPGDGFGEKVQLSGNLLVVGAPDEDEVGGAKGVNVGAAYVFSQNHETWIEKARLKSTTRRVDGFGESIGVFGDTVVVGTSRDDDRHDTPTGLRKPPTVVSGTVHIYKSTDGKWKEEARLKAGNPASLDGEDRFGGSVAISQNRIIVGASDDDENCGAAYIFKKGRDGWIQEAYLQASPRKMIDQFGSGVLLSDRHAFVAAIYDRTDYKLGAVHVFPLDPQGVK